MWPHRGREALLDSPLLKDHSRKGKRGKVPIPAPSFASTAQLMERLPHTGSHGVHTRAHRCGDTPSQLHVRPARARDAETKHRTQAPEPGLELRSSESWSRALHDTGLPLRKGRGERGVGVARSS